MGHADVRLSRSSNRITDSERCGCGLQHCRLRRGDCVQPACWRNGLHHYDGDLWPRPLVQRSVIFPSHLDVITGPLAVAEQAPPGEWHASDRLAAGQALSRTCCAPSGPTWPTSATAHPAPPGQPGPAQPQSSVLCICPVGSLRARSPAPGTACRSSCSGHPFLRGRACRSRQYEAASAAFTFSASGMGSSRMRRPERDGNGGRSRAQARVHAVGKCDHRPAVLPCLRGTQTDFE
jgi:hypothetical protein